MSEQTYSLPVLFVPDLVVLPGMVVPIPLDDAAQATVDAARASESGKLLVAPRLDDRYPTHGVVSSIVQVGRIPGAGAGSAASGPNGYITAAVVKGEKRAHIGTGTTGHGTALWVEVTEIDEAEATAETKALGAEYKKLVLAMLQRREAWQVIDAVNKMSDPSDLADTSGYSSWLTDVQKRELLETDDVAARLQLLIDWTSEHIAETEVSDKIADDVRNGMEKQQKEFLLRQQLNAIRKELGEDEPDGADDYRGRVEAADLPDKVREAALREVGKLERSSDQSPESGWIRTWLDTVLDLPWNVTTTDSADIKAAREILDADHHGLDDVKDRIVEYLAVRARRAERGLQVVGGRGSGAVMVLAGPPGVGKTSLGESVARALGRKFVRVALGGVRDEAEIRGHRRTYVGALPGRIVRAIGEAGSMNPVVLLDEIDKVGSDFRGDPAAALLEVLDPAQNHTFRDHYLDLDLDLSDVVFLATANVIENIPSALLDRMELVTIDGYTEDDKVAIAGDYLLPRQRERAALTAEEITVTDDALREIAANYTREPGVRQFERLLAKLMRKVATNIENGSAAVPVTVGEPELKDLLGRPRFTPESEERTAVPGVATGLAVTGMGGDVLFIEANRTDAGEGKGGLQLTGQLGDVMKESAQIALSYVRAHASELGVEPKALDGTIHVHVPAGAVPKDGPSAGITMVTALVSMATGRKVRAEVGMTGEVTLNGRVLPIGGLKQKLLAAQRNGLTQVFISPRNEADLDDVPAEILEDVTVTPLADVAEIVKRALEPAADEVSAAA
ncbi:endopeptidase La [Gordonia oryzae]|uniref:Lon protease n=1 Tax=Gordonia oryzae TaxID=2487349 RepID=A0A3N4GZT5_9ACTN|nr:endopeptidase La [Gordonia oryzae]RPA58504.1 endopeptidase La [Gordonia oryzae]